MSFDAPVYRDLTFVVEPTVVVDEVALADRASCFAPPRLERSDKLAFSCPPACSVDKEALQFSGWMVLKEVPPGLALSHFTSCCDTETVFDQVSNALAHECVDTAVNRPDAELQCTVVHGGEALRFLVNFFRDDEFRVVVEFRRMAGDAFVFFGLFRRVLRFVHDVVHTSGVCDIVDAPCCEATPATPVIVEDSTLHGLLPMAESPLLDVSREGSLALARLSAVEHARSTLRSCGRVPVLVSSLLQSDDDELARCGATLLANLGVGVPLLDKDTLCALEPVLAQLLTRDSSAVALARDTQRQIASAMEALSQQSGWEPSGCLVQALQAQTLGGDTRLSGPARRALANLHLVC